MPDLARAMVTASGDTSLRDAVLHAPTGPPLTMREMAEAIAAAAGTTAKVGVLPSWLVRGAGRVSTPMRELAEMLYQFESPFVMDSTRSQALLGQSPTPLDDAVRETVAWWRQQDAEGRPTYGSCMITGDCMITGSCMITRGVGDV